MTHSLRALEWLCGKEVVSTVRQSIIRIWSGGHNSRLHLDAARALQHGSQREGSGVKETKERERSTMVDLLSQGDEGHGNRQCEDGPWCYKWRLRRDRRYHPPSRWTPYWQWPSRTPQVPPCLSIGQASLHTSLSVGGFRQSGNTHKACYDDNGDQCTNSKPQSGDTYCTMPTISYCRHLRFHGPQISRPDPTSCHHRHCITAHRNINFI